MSLVFKHFSLDPTTTEDIKGIIYTKQEFKKSLFADDASFILDVSFKSFQTVMEIFENLFLD